MTYREFRFLAEFRDYLTGAGEGDNPAEVTPKLEYADGSFVLVLVPTVNGHWQGSGPWVRIRLPIVEVPWVLDEVLPHAGISVRLGAFWSKDDCTLPFLLEDLAVPGEVLDELDALEVHYDVIVATYFIRPWRCTFDPDFKDERFRRPDPRFMDGWQER